jgi:MFS family permease
MGKHWKNPYHISYLLIAANVLSALSSDLHLPAMPTMVKELNTTAYLVQLIMPIAFFASLFTRLLWGPLTDAWGRRVILMPILMTNLVGNLMSAIAPTIEWILVGRFIAGLAFGSCNIVAMMMISDLFDGKERARMLTVLDTLMPAFMISAPILGAYILQWCGWRGNFIFILIAQLIVNFLCWWWIPETHTDQEDLNLKKAFKNYAKPATDVTLILICMIPGIAAGSYAFMLVQAPFIYINQFTLTPQMCGYLMALPLIGQFLAGSFHQVLLKYLMPVQTLRIGILVTLGLAINVGLLLWQCYPWTISSLFVISTLQCIAWSFLLAPCISLAFDRHPKQRGAVSSLISITRGILWSSFSHVGAVFYDQTEYPFLWGTLIAALFIVLLWIIVHWQSVRTPR